MKNFAKRLLKAKAASIASMLVRGYQKTFSPDHGAINLVSGSMRCRFFPSCSEYTVAAFRQYGLFRGAVVSLKRIVRCNPLHPGGYDPLR